MSQIGNRILGIEKALKGTVADTFIHGRLQYVLEICFFNFGFSRVDGSILIYGKWKDPEGQTVSVSGSLEKNSSFSHPVRYYARTEIWKLGSYHGWKESLDKKDLKSKEHGLWEEWEFKMIWREGQSKCRKS